MLSVGIGSVKLSIGISVVNGGSSVVLAVSLRFVAGSVVVISKVSVELKSASCGIMVVVLAVSVRFAKSISVVNGVSSVKLFALLSGGNNSVVFTSTGEAIVPFTKSVEFSNVISVALLGISVVKPRISPRVGVLVSFVEYARVALSTITLSLILTGNSVVAASVKLFEAVELSNVELLMGVSTRISETVVKLELSAIISIVVTLSLADADALSVVMFSVVKSVCAVVDGSRVVG